MCEGREQGEKVRINKKGFAYDHYSYVSLLYVKLAAPEAVRGEGSAKAKPHTTTFHQPVVLSGSPQGWQNLQ